MPKPTPKKDRDEITVAKSIFDEIVELSESEETSAEERARIGGKARSAIAKKAAETRWHKSKT